MRKSRITEKDFEVDGKDIKSFRLKGVWENSLKRNNIFKILGLAKGLFVIR